MIDTKHIRARLQSHHIAYFIYCSYYFKRNCCARRNKLKYLISFTHNLYLFMRNYLINLIESIAVRFKHKNIIKEKDGWKRNKSQPTPHKNTPNHKNRLQRANKHWLNIWQIQNFSLQCKGKEKYFITIVGDMIRQDCFTYLCRNMSSRFHLM